MTAMTRMGGISADAEQTRIAIHEAGHAVLRPYCDTLLGSEVLR